MEAPLPDNMAQDIRDAGEGVPLLAARERSAQADAPAFGRVLDALRAQADVCFPPVGVGSFDVLLADEQEVVVWYTPARDGQQQGERSIPATSLHAAWEALVSGAALDETALVEIAASPAIGRWLLALLALLPTAHVDGDPPSVALADAPNPSSASAQAPST